MKNNWHRDGFHVKFEAHLEQFVLLQSLSGYIQGKVIRVNLAKFISINDTADIITINVETEQSILGHG